MCIRDSIQEMQIVHLLFAIEIERLHQIKLELIDYVDNIGQQNTNLLGVVQKLEDENFERQRNLRTIEEEKQKLRNEVERLTQDLERLTASNLELQRDLNSFQQKLEIRDGLHELMQKEIAAEKEAHHRLIESKVIGEILLGFELERQTTNHFEVQSQTVLEPEKRKSVMQSQFDGLLSSQAKEMIDFHHSEATLSKSILIEDKLRHLQDSLLRFEESLLQGKSIEKVSTKKL
eukprot:TRINITY_DN1868_c0_g1_i1.p1 TRINITY_DN1868_c0_g1~~TRINITY_DN1868_c0_g1_i1.p1  ORF type:complete len:233 (-),score=44.78 TRINITY_DN1868_c0_g1_i1:116-814(-)